MNHKPFGTAALEVSVARGPQADVCDRATELLRRRIDEGVYMDRLPGVRKLCAELGISLQTANNAVNRLVAQGACYRIQGLGTFISMRHKQARSHRLAAVVGGIGGPVHAALMAGIQLESEKRHQTLIQTGNIELIPVEDALLKVLEKEAVDGVLVWPYTQVDNAPFLRIIQQRNLPAVGVMALDPDRPCPYSYVINDDTAGAWMGARHLIENGRRSIAFVSYRWNQINHRLFERRRRQGYEQALEEAGIAPVPTLFDESQAMDPAPHAPGEDWVKPLLQHDALLCYNDWVAISLFKHLRRRGVRVPDDIALVGYDGIDAGRAIELTTVAQPFREIGARAVGLLIEEIEGRRNQPVHEILPPRLVVGKTTKA